ncbi:hypothetical protein CKAH01_17376 [Colletotrichum kahawae]|uniref:Uncharacterized protein n=1 Tax=Colletotrichum kahawae TaxID=34407 RepID=A0AAD9YC41_COLKA|nr:hypothetical protein CKAH01_17376 [Colletotrichum kahawae]
MDVIVLQTCITSDVPVNTAIALASVHRNLKPTLKIIHRRLIHAHPSRVIKACRYIGIIFSKEEIENFHCEACHLAKLTEIVSRNSPLPLTQISEEIHLNLIKVKPLSMTSKRYALHFLDKYSSYHWLVLLLNHHYEVVLNLLPQDTKDLWIQRSITTGTSDSPEKSPEISAITLASSNASNNALDIAIEGLDLITPPPDEIMLRSTSQSPPEDNTTHGDEVNKPSQDDKTTSSRPRRGDPKPPGHYKQLSSIHSYNKKLLLSPECFRRAIISLRLSTPIPNNIKIYVRSPTSFSTNDGKVWLLKKALYSFHRAQYLDQEDLLLSAQDKNEYTIEEAEEYIEKTSYIN